MFNGKCEMINVIERNKFGFTGNKKNYSSVFDSHWNKMSLSLNGNFAPNVIPEKPSNLEEMLKVSSELAQGIDYVRVDLYNQDGRIVFGELTSYPQSGQNTYHLENDLDRERLNSQDYDRLLGSKLILDKYD
jgi:glutamine synthetase type III